MNADATWRKFARRSALIVSGLCCLVILTGCPWDEDEAQDFIPTIWEVAWMPDDDGNSPVIIPWDVDDLTVVSNPGYNNTIAGYAVSVAPGTPIVIMINDTSGPFNITLTTTVIQSDFAEGTYSGRDSNDDPINGSWTITKQ